LKRKPKGRLGEMDEQRGQRGLRGRCGLVPSRGHRPGGHEKKKGENKMRILELKNLLPGTVPRITRELRTGTITEVERGFPTFKHESNGVPEEGAKKVNGNRVRGWEHHRGWSRGSEKLQGEDHQKKGGGCTGKKLLQVIIPEKIFLEGGGPSF